MRRATFHPGVGLAIVAALLLLAVWVPQVSAAQQALLNQPPEGFVALFNGKDLTGWKGLLKGPYDNPDKRAALTADEAKQLQQEADENMRTHWKAADGILVFDGKGRSLCTAKDYGDFEMLVDWKIEKAGDSGIYLRGSPQVQIWDTGRVDSGAQVGSGGLYNNQKNPSKPSKPADKPVGEWNTFRIIMIGDKVTVYLNDELVVDNVVMENYWDRKKPIYPAGQIELQNHGNFLYFRNIYIREILPAAEVLEGFVPVFNGRDMTGWTGNTTGYYAKDGKIICDPTKSGGNVYTSAEYSDFIVRFDFKLTPGANNGLAIRAPLGGDAAYQGMEIQILEDSHPKYANLQPYQFHGSIYGTVPAQRDCLKPVGEWNTEEVIAKGRQITVKVNGKTIVDADLDKASTPQTMDHRDHPGLKREKGHVGFCGHGDYLEFRNIRIKSLDKQP
ncbi:MAG: hypothetical protein A2Y77_02515 [Planctomycetes bacterium RBG_13_62_9]|nr:MAG: hypothetical protein A2Y77_02515 [Planctomycetes bacterium RBG_13_62_9]